MYKLNNTEISENRMLELVDDLAMFPLNDADINLPIVDRKKKYLAELNEKKELKLSDSLKLLLILDL